MAITLLDAPTPYTPWNNTKFYLIPTIADSGLAATLTELSTMTDLTPQVTEAAGWTQQGSAVDSQSFSGAALKLGGPTTFEDSSLTFRRSKTGTDIRDLLAFGDSAYIGIMPDGNTAGRLMDVFKTEVIGNPKSVAIGDVATITYQFSVLKALFDYEIPAA